MNKHLVYEDKLLISRIISVHNETLHRLKEINEDYKALGFGLLDTAGLKSLFHHTDTFFRSQAESLIGEIPSFGGFKMKREAFIDTLELPDYSSIAAKVAALKKHLAQNLSSPLILGNFEMNEGEVVINEDLLSATLDGHRIYAQTESEAKVFRAMQQVLKSYLELDEIVRVMLRGSGGLSNWRPEYYFTRDNEGQLIINPAFYQLIISGE